MATTALQIQNPLDLICLFTVNRDHAYRASVYTMCAGMATIYDQQHVGLVRLAQWRSTLDATVNLSNIHTLIPHLLRKTSSFAYLVTGAHISMYDLRGYAHGL